MESSVFIFWRKGHCNKLSVGLSPNLCDVLVPYSCQCGEEITQIEKGLFVEREQGAGRLQLGKVGYGLIKQNAGGAWNQKFEDSKQKSSDEMVMVIQQRGDIFVEGGHHS